MTSRFILPFSDVGSGIEPPSGAKLFFFETDGVTPKDTFTTKAGASGPSNDNPVIADSVGVFPAIYITGEYLVTLTDKTDSQKFGLAPVTELLTVAESEFIKNFDTLSKAVVDLDLTDGDTIYWKERTTGNGGSAHANVVLASSVTPNTFDIVQCTGIPTLAIVLITSDIINTKQFGVGDGVVNNADAALRAIAVAEPLNRAVYTESGSYTVDKKLVIPSNIEFYGDGRFSTLFIQSSLNNPSIIIETPSGSEYQNIHDLGVRYNFDSIGSSTQVGFKFLGTRRYIMENCSVDNLGQSVTNYSGIGILHDMDTVTNAYTFRIVNNIVLGSTYGLWTKGPLTSSVITRNHFKTANGIRIDRQSVQPGTTAVFGNQIYGNLIQAHSSATFGTGNGIDFGQSDAALGFVFAFSNQIGWNYIERFLNGILFRDGARNNHVDSQAWDNATSQIVDLNPNKDGYSGFDAQNFELSTRTQIIKLTPKGTQHEDKNGGAITIGGTSATLNVDANDVVITTDKRIIRLTGNGAPRTGAIISRASAIEGQELTLIGFSWNVGLSSTGILFDGGVGSTLGNGSGEQALLNLKYDSGQDVWIETGRNTRV